MSGDYPLSRRDALKYTGAGLVATTFAGSAMAHGGGASEGDGSNIGDGSAHAYVEYSRGRGRLSAIGVHLSGSALAGLSATPEAHHLGLPNGNTGPFSHVGLDWNPEGHEPPNLYDHPHFDVHFYMPSEDDIAAIPPMFPPANSPTYTLPPELMPPYTVHTDQLPSPQTAPRAAIPGMGEHLVTLPLGGSGSAHSIPQSPGDDGWSVFIWGAFDMDGDATGRIIFMEPMVTVEYLEQLAADNPSGDEVRRPIAMPERFRHAGWYPTEFVVAYDGSDYTISLESFEHFAGHGA